MKIYAIEKFETDDFGFADSDVLEVYVNRNTACNFIREFFKGFLKDYDEVIEDDEVFERYSDWSRADYHPDENGLNRMILRVVEKEVK